MIGARVRHPMLLNNVVARGSDVFGMLEIRNIFLRSPFNVHFAFLELVFDMSKNS